MIRQLIVGILALGVLFTTGCSKQAKNGLKVIASPVPHAEILKAAEPALRAKGIQLIIITTDDYNMPNRAVADGEADANFFQHQPFLNEQISQFHYPLESIAAIEIEPMGLYSKKVQKLSELKYGAKVSLPNDPTNEGRALLLLEKAGLIRLDNPTNLRSSLLNISENPKLLHFIEMDAAMLPRTLRDVDLAAINTNYALGAGLNPLKDALALEGENSPYANVLVIRKDEAGREDIQALKEALTSEEMRTFILDKYKGAVLPAF